MFLILLQNTNLLKCLYDFTIYTAAAVEMAAGTGTAVLTATVDSLEGSYADGFAEVDVSGYGGGAGVEPIWIVGGEFFVGGSLDDVDPGGDFEFALEG